MANVMDEIDAKLNELRGAVAVLLDLLEDAMGELCAFTKEGKHAGYYDTLAHSTARDIGDALVEAGRWERHEDGYGRRWFYRPKQKESRDGSDSNGA